MTHQRHTRTGLAVRTGARRSRWSRGSAWIACGVAGALSAALLAGCRAKGAWTEADDLRAKVLELETALSRTSAERDEARATLAEIERARVAGSGNLSADVLAALPRCAGITIDRLSGLGVGPDGGRASGADKRSDGASADASNTPLVVNVYIRPYDGVERFVQVVGRLRVRVDGLPPASAVGDAPPVALGSVDLGPAELREAYRSSPLGTHYTIVVPLSTAPAARASLAISAEFSDALSGRVHATSLVVPASAR